MTNNNQTLIDDCRALADFLEARPHMVNIETGSLYLCGIVSKGQLADAVKLLGTSTKRMDDDYVHFDRYFGKTFHVSVFVTRQSICEAVKVKKILPAVEEKFIPAQHIEALPEREIEVLEWICPESILASASEDVIDADTFIPLSEVPTPEVPVKADVIAETFDRR